MSVTFFRSWRESRLPFFCALWCAAAPPVVSAQSVDDLVGTTIADVRVVVDGQRVRQPSILELVETRVGQALSMREVRESVTHLFALGQYEDVRVEVDLTAEGSALCYELVPLAVVDRIELRGNRGLSDDDIRETVTLAHGRSFEVTAAPDVRDTVLGLYRRRGFINATVHTAVEGSGGTRTLRVEIESGERARIQQIFLTGAGIRSRPVVLARLGLVEGRPYDGEDIDRRLLDYESDLREQRFYEVETSHDVTVTETGNAVDLRVQVRRGPRITILLEGDGIPDASIVDLIPVERERSINEDLLEDADRRIESYLNGLGYRDASVAHERLADGEELSIVFTVAGGPLYEIANVVIAGNLAVPLAALEPLLLLRPDFPLITRELESVLNNVAEHYRQRGFATARVEAVMSEVGDGVEANRPPDLGRPPERVRIVVRIDIVEGPQTRVGSVSLDGAEPARALALRSLITSEVNAPYDVSRVVSDRDGLRAAYLNDGFERVVVTVEPTFDDALENVGLVYRVNEGSQILVEHVLIVGNESIDSDAIRREVTLAAGEPLNLAEVAETRRRLNEMGLFRRIDIREFSHGGRGQQDVVIMVDEAPATRIAYGGGLEASVRLRREATVEGSQAVERLEFAPRGFFQIGRGNLWGKNRSVDLFTRVSLRRKNDAIESTPSAARRTLSFNEYRIVGTYQEPRVLGLDWDGFVTGFVEQAIRPGFDLFRRGVNAQVRRRLTATMLASIDYGLGQNNTTNKELNAADEPLVDRLFPQVRLSTFSVGLVHDTRDDPADPKSGELLTVDSSLAARAIGSEVGFVKGYLGAFVYRQIPGADRFVVAGGVRVGLASPFVRSFTVMPELPPDVEGLGTVRGTPVEIDVGELPLSERFFAGGDRSVRGFALDRLGDEATIDQDGFPLGGNATLIFNAELRTLVTRTVDVVGFLDAGNVYDRVENISLARIRGGAGFGVRYRSPVGPIRVDLGFKLDRQQFGNGEFERPTALHISIGQAF